MAPLPHTSTARVNPQVVCSTFLVVMAWQRGQTRRRTPQKHLVVRLGCVLHTLIPPPCVLTECNPLGGNACLRPNAVSTHMKATQLDQPVVLSRMCEHAVFPFPAPCLTIFAGKEALLWAVETTVHDFGFGRYSSGDFGDHRAVRKYPGEINAESRKP